MKRMSPGGSRRNLLSLALFALSAVLFAAVAIVLYQGRGDNAGSMAPPASTPGHNEAIHVKQALEANGLKVVFAPGGGRSNELSVAGQLFEVDGAQLYVFIYPGGVTQRADDSSDVELTAMTVVNTRGTPVAGGPPRVFTGSNVVGVLYGATDEIAGKVRKSIEGLR